MVRFLFFVVMFSFACISAATKVIRMTEFPSAFVSSLLKSTKVTVVLFDKPSKEMLNCLIPTKEQSKPRVYSLRYEKGLDVPYQRITSARAKKLGATELSKGYLLVCGTDQYHILPDKEGYLLIVLRKL